MGRMIWNLDAWHWIIWNVFLAAIPVVAGYALSLGASRFTIKRRIIPWLVWLPLLAVWFAFLPNTCYLLTEWRHFLMDGDMPQRLARADEDPGTMLSVAKWGLFSSSCTQRDRSGDLHPGHPAHPRAAPTPSESPAGFRESRSSS